jgi:hypothetical protein
MGFESEEQRHRLVRFAEVQSRHCIGVVGRRRRAVGSCYRLLKAEGLLPVGEQSRQSHRMIHRALHCCFGRLA